jgi:Xaa-Pro aminopeptidase
MPVCVDFALARDGYIHDQTRTLVVGSLERRLAEAHDVCRRIHDEMRDRARPGVTGEELWQRCLAMADDAGLAGHFMGFGGQQVRFVGHGLGLELDELPVLAPRQRMALEAGHVIAVEPKFFFPGAGAVGLENTYVVTNAGLDTVTVTAEEVAAKS